MRLIVNWSKHCWCKWGRRPARCNERWCFIEWREKNEEEELHVLGSDFLLADLEERGYPNDSTGWFNMILLLRSNTTIDACGNLNLCVVKQQLAAFRARRERGVLILMVPGSWSPQPTVQIEGQAAVTSDTTIPQVKVEKMDSGIFGSTQAPTCSLALF